MTHAWVPLAAEACVARPATPPRWTDDDSPRSYLALVGRSPSSRWLRTGSTTLRASGRSRCRHSRDPKPIEWRPPGDGPAEAPGRSRQALPEEQPLISGRAVLQSTEQRKSHFFVERGGLEAEGVDAD